MAPAEGRIGAMTADCMAGFSWGARGVAGAIGLAAVPLLSAFAVVTAVGGIAARCAVSGFVGGSTTALSVLFGGSERNCSESLPTMAARMKLIQIGSAA